MFLIGVFSYSSLAQIWDNDAAVSPVLRDLRRDSVERILETGRTYSIVWRPANVRDQRRNNSPSISATDEWLWRWDRTHPRQIFRNGFIPRVNIDGLGDFLRNPATDLRSYVSNNQASVFVSTTRRNWAPRARANTFRYDIFAPGGIEVNPTLGSHQYQNQEEVAFFGGIRTEYIYGAVEYDENLRQVRYHLNPLYQGPTDPLATRGSSRCRLRVVYYFGLRRQQQNYCLASTPSYCSANRSSRKKRSSNDELMRSPGQTLTALSDCSYWYIVKITSMNFDQPGEVGGIEPYGYLDVYIKGAKSYQKSNVWYQENTGKHIPSVTKGANVYSHRSRCLVLQADTDSGNVNVCFKGFVTEYDPVIGGDDEIARLFEECVQTHRILTTWQYYDRFDGAQGSLELQFSVSDCDKKCMKTHLSDDSINGSC